MNSSNDMVHLKALIAYLSLERFAPQ